MAKRAIPSLEVAMAFDELHSRMATCEQANSRMSTKSVDKRPHRRPRRRPRRKELRRGRPHPRRARRDGHRPQRREGPQHWRTGDDVGGEAVRRGVSTPHPAASRPPSPARGEGEARSIGGEELTVARETETEVPHAQPSPLAGEGGAPHSGAPGEGTPRKKRTARKVPEPIAFARQLRKTPTDAEEVLWQMLRSQPFRQAKFRRQVPIGPFVADFLSHSAKVVIEADGPVHDAAKDARRDSWFVERGWRVLRFSNRQVLTNSRHVTDSILSVINGQPTGDPSP